MWDVIVDFEVVFNIYVWLKVMRMNNNKFEFDVICFFGMGKDVSVKG